MTRRNELRPTPGKRCQRLERAKWSAGIAGHGECGPKLFATVRRYGPGGRGIQHVNFFREIAARDLRQGRGCGLQPFECEAQAVFMFRGADQAKACRRLDAEGAAVMGEKPRKVGSERAEKRLATCGERTLPRI